MLTPALQQVLLLSWQAQLAVLAGLLVVAPLLLVPLLMLAVQEQAQHLHYWELPIEKETAHQRLPGPVLQLGKRRQRGKLPWAAPAV
jgi:hypothetical protein